MAEWHCSSDSAIDIGDTQDMRKALELEVRAIKIVQSSFCTRLNTLALVNQLPPEILAYVFHLLREVWPLPYSRSRAAIFNWVQVTYVCRQWRTVALDNPFLWTNIPFSLGNTWKEEFLRRSRMAPISIAQEDYLSDNDIKSVARTLTQHLCRIQKLHLSSDQYANFMHILPMLCDPAPLLESLILHNNRRSSANSNDPSIPLEIFNRTAPRLRCLDLRNWQLSWTSLQPFSSLVYLDLWGCSVLPEGFHLALDSLEKMHLLEDLKLADVLPPLPDDVTPYSTYGPTISLPHLRKLYLKDNIRSCGLILKHIITPVTAEHEIYCADAEGGHEFLLPWLSTEVDRSMNILKLSIENDSYGFNVVVSNYNSKAWSVEFAPECHRSPKPSFYLSFHTDSRRFRESAMERLCQMLPLGNLESLSVFWDDTLSTHDWFAILGGCKSLARAEIRYTCAPSLCELLTTNISLSQSLFPSLVSMKFTDTYFGQTRDFSANFLNSLSCRASSLKELVIHWSCVYETLVEKLRCVVTKVEWDGRENYGIDAFAQYLPGWDSESEAAESSVDEEQLSSSSDILSEP
ncbi:hypothetical protein EVG20_g1381 [Dentipellis fragilis]|uniref:F-box domain-containing protein n=1 Tax=Dentipellis fragilis TaxID=205917 RepID=A0A4Y9ZBV8_9AGAM|nr:hypothetical protein EVG20_g1381 [Dentipellis fragilis]